MNSLCGIPKGNVNAERFMAVILTPLLLLLWLWITPLASLADVPCQDFSYDMAPFPARLPSLGTNVCVTSANAVQGNRILRQSYHIFDRDMDLFYRHYKNDLYNQGWNLKVATSSSHHASPKPYTIFANYEEEFYLHMTLLDDPEPGFQVHLQLPSRHLGPIDADPAGEG